MSRPEPLRAAWLRAGDVELRPFEAGLSDTVLEVRNHESIRRNMRDPAPLVAENHYRWVQANVLDERRVHLFVVFEAQSAVGIALLRDFRDDGAEVGLMVVDAARRPLTCYAGAVMITSYAFEQVGLGHIVSLVPLHNEHALTFNRHFGFEAAGSHEDPVYHRLVLGRERFFNHPTHRRFREKHSLRYPQPA